MCQGSVSIVPGNLDKMRLHLENQHEVFHQLDFLIAINFLEDFEKEEIISKALPRMKVIFDGAKLSGQRNSSDPHLEEEKTEGFNKDVNEVNTDNVYEDSSSDDDNFEIIIETKPYETKEMKDNKQKEEDGLNADQGIKGFEEKEKVVKDQKDKSRKSAISDPKHGDLPPQKKAKQPRKEMQTVTPRKEVLDVNIVNNNSKGGLAVTTCPHCNKEMLKRNIRRHLRVKHGEEAGERSLSLLLYKCKICGSQLASRTLLKSHTSEVHTLNIEDVEAMVVTGPVGDIHDEIDNEKIDL